MLKWALTFDKSLWNLSSPRGRRMSKVSMSSQHSGILIAELNTDGAVNFVFKVKGDMIIKNRFEAIDRCHDGGLFGSFRWERIGKETILSVFPKTLDMPYRFPLNNMAYPRVWDTAY
ncbi:hypothetical protein Tco_0527079 [Tanacetum coccineum]